MIGVKGAGPWKGSRVRVPLIVVVVVMGSGTVGLPASSTLPLHPAAAPVAFQKRTYKELSRSDYPQKYLFKLDDDGD